MYAWSCVWIRIFKDFEDSYFKDEKRWRVDIQLNVLKEFKTLKNVWKELLIY